MSTDLQPLAAPSGLADDVSPLGERSDSPIRIMWGLLGVLGAMLLLGAGDDSNRRQFYHSYLFGYVLALDVALGALFWVLIHHIAGAGWSVGLRRVYENITHSILPLALLFIPVL